MNFNTTQSTFELPPVGNHVAKCVKIVDLGTQKREYKGEESQARQMIVTWELPFERREDDQPFVISKFYTQSLGEKANLTKDLITWLGSAPDAKKFTAKSLLGKDCQVVVSERAETGKRVVSAVTSVSKGTNTPKETHNPLVYFDLDNFDVDVYNSLSSRIQEMIAKSPEYAKALEGVGTADSAPPVSEDDIPF